jgi:hypothetical protein
MTESKLGRVEGVVRVVLPSGVSSIGGDAFNGYTALRTLTIQSGCAEIEDTTLRPSEYLGAWGGCTSLIKVTIPGTCTNIGSFAFCGCLSLTELLFPSSVRSLGNFAVCGCSALKELTIPSSVRSIATSAFCGCSELAGLRILPSVTTFSSWAFHGCSALAQVTVPANLAEFGCRFQEAFEGVKTLERVTLVGSLLNAAVAKSAAPTFARDAKPVSPTLSGRKFGCFVVIAAP